MAVAAVDTESRYVVLVAERDGLRFAHASISDVWRPLDFHRDPAEGGNHEYRAENGGAGHGVGTAMKNLRHDLRASYKKETQNMT